MSTLCRTLEVSRSHLYTRLLKNERPQRGRKPTKEEEDMLVGSIKEVLKERPAYGYRRITIILRKNLGIALNHKKTYRIMKENQLLLQRYATKPLRVHDGKIITLRSNLRWCSDIFAIQCWNGDRVTVAFAQDCHDREIISWIASSKGIEGAMIRDLMTESLENRFGHASKVPHALQWLSDNGPQYVARETIHFGRLLGLEICTRPPIALKAMVWQRLL